MRGALAPRGGEPAGVTTPAPVRAGRDPAPSRMSIAST